MRTRCVLPFVAVGCALLLGCAGGGAGRATAAAAPAQDAPGGESPGSGEQTYKKRFSGDMPGFASAQPLKDVELVFMPSEDPTATARAAAQAFGRRRVSVAPLADGRRPDERRLIGNNRQYWPVTTSTDPGTWCAEQMAGLLREAGVQVTSSDPEVVLSGTIRQLFVRETEQYDGKVILLLTASDPDGKVLWSGEVLGRARAWGRTYRLDNYRQTISDALLDALGRWFGDRRLQAAVAE